MLSRYLEKGPNLVAPQKMEPVDDAPRELWADYVSFQNIRPFRGRLKLKHHPNKKGLKTLTLFFQI